MPTAGPRSAVPTDPASTPAEPPATFSWVVCPDCGSHVATVVAACPKCGAPVPATLDLAARGKVQAKWQEVVDEEYELRELVGCGPCSCVFRAVDRGLGDEVALKVLELPASSRDATFVAVQRQVAAASAIKHPHAVVPRTVTCEGNVALLAMPFIAGRTLRDMAAAGDRLTFDAVGTILLDVAEALDKAHATGVVHGGLRPSNVLVDGQGRGYVTDFGLAAALPTSRTGHNPATVERAAYAAPEQVHGAPADGRADQYSLAVIAHELLSGRGRLRGWTPGGLATLEPVEVSSDTPLRPGLPVTGNAALRQAFARQPGHRFPNTTTFVEALIGRRSATPEGLPTMHPVLELPKRRRGILAPLLVTLAAIGAGLVFFGPWKAQEGPWTRSARESAARTTARRAAAANAPGQSGGGGGGGGGPSADATTSTPIATGAAAEGPSFIRVTADRAGAIVVVDGRPRGIVPTTVRVSPGNHTVSLRGRGFGGVSQSVSTSAGGTATVSFAAGTP